MTIPTAKQKKIISLAQQELTIPEIVKETGITYKTVKKYAGMSTTSEPPSQVPQKSVIDVRSPKFAPPKPKRVRDTTRSYASYENVPYYRPVSIAPPSGRGLVTVTDAKPLIPAKPLTKMQKEQEEFKNRKGIDISWVPRENKERKRKNERIEREEARDIRNAKHDKKRAKAVADIEQTLIENKRLRDRRIFELDYPLEPNDGLTESRVRDAVKDVVKFDKEQQHKITMAYWKLRTIQNNEVYRVKKKQIDDKFVGDVALSVLGFVGDVVKFVIMVSSKPKIFKAQLVKKPMQARVIK